MVFINWIETQQERQDEIGDWARDFMRSHFGSNRVVSYAELRECFIETSAC